MGIIKELEYQLVLISIEKVIKVIKKWIKIKHFILILF